MNKLSTLRPYLKVIRNALIGCFSFVAVSTAAELSATESSSTRSDAKEVSSTEASAPASENSTAKSSPMADTDIDELLQASTPPQQQEPAAAVAPSDSSMKTAEPPTEASEAAQLLPTIPVPQKDVKTDLPASKNAPKARQLEEIVVTATKREESARDVPVTINAYTGDDLMKKGATSLDEIVSLQPGTSKSGFRVVMRGVATSSLGSYGTSEEVGRFFGDIPLGTPAGRGILIDLDPFDMKTIEVAKGPQGTLFGGTALAGAVRYIPMEADVHDFSAAIRGGVGSITHSKGFQQEANAMVNIPIADTFGLRLAGTWRDRPGTIDDLYSGKPNIDTKTTKQWRALGTWQPSDNFDLKLTYLNFRENLGDLGFTDRPNRYENSLLRTPQPSIMTSRVFSGRAEYKWDTFSIVAMATDLKSRFFDVADVSMLLLGSSTTAAALVSSPVDARAPKTRTYEARIMSTETTDSDWWILQDWDYLVGFSDLNAEQSVDGALVATVGLSQLPALPLPINPAVAVNQHATGTATERAVFFDFKRGLFDRHVELNFGGRLAKSQLDAYTYIDVLGVPANAANSSTKQSRFNPKLALTWHLTEDFSIYSSAAQGFRFGGVNSGVTAGIDQPRTFTSDSLWNYEAGVRTEWLDRTLQFDVTAYRIDWDNLQIQQISSTAQNFVSNIGSARILGAESTLRWNLPSDVFLIPPGLSIALSGGYTDARTTEAFDSSDGAVGAGTRLPITPYVSGNISISWQGALGDYLINSSVTDSYSGSRKNALIETYELPSYQTLGAVLTVTNPSLSFQPTISLSGMNLLDKVVPNFAFKTEYASDYVYVLNRPRTVLLSLQLNFGPH